MRVLKGGFRKNSIISYIFFFSLLVVAILAAMSTFILSSLHERIREDFYESNEMVLSTMARAHENELQILQDISTQMNLSIGSTRFLLSEQPQKSTPLKQHLNQYRAVNHFFDVLYYFYQKDEYLFNHSSSIALSYFTEKGYLLEKVSPAGMDRLLRETHRERVILPEQEITGKLVVSYDMQSPSAIYLFPIAPDYDSVMLYFVGARHFDDLLAPAEGEKRNNYLIDNLTGQIIAFRGAEPVAAEDILALTADRDSFQEIAELSGRKYLLTTWVGKEGIRYCTVQDAELLDTRMLTGSWSALLILLLCSIPASLLITWMARRLLRSFRSINKLLNQEDSLYSFDSVQSGVQALMEESSKIKDSSQSLRRTRFVRSFVRSDFQTEEALRTEARESGFAMDEPLFCVVIIGNRHIENQAGLHERILRLVKESREVQGYGINLISNNQTVLLLFGYAYEHILSFCQEMIEQGKIYGEEMVAALSDAHTDILTGSKAYIEADVAFSCRFLYDQNVPIAYRELEEKDAEGAYPEAVRKLLTQFRSAIQFRHEAEANQVVDELCAYLQQNRSSLITFRFIFDDIQHILVLEWRDEEQTLSQFYNVFTLSQCLTMEDFRALLREATHLVLSNDRKAVQEMSELAQRATDYMKEHYREPELSMGALADQLNVSPVTLSMEFKNETGISPSEYLTSLRIARAKELLRSSGMLVREISSEVGYEDEHVFTRRFKKYTGMTPGQYRSSAQE